MEPPLRDTPFDPTAHPYRWVVLAGVWLTYFSFGVAIASLAPLVAVIEADLGFSHSSMGTVLGAWQMVYVAAALPAGILIDRIGARWALLLCIGIVAASSALRAMAIDHTTLLLAVGVVGLGGPLVSIGSPRVISQWFVGSDRGLAMGIYITGPLLGNILATSLTHSVFMPLFDQSWRITLFGYAAFILTTGIAWIVVSGHPAMRRVEMERASAPREPQIRVFVDLLRVPAVRILLVMSVGIFFLNHGFLGWLPEILRASGLDQTAAGFWSSVPTASAIVAALVIPRLATPKRRMAIFLALFVIAAIGTGLIACGPGWHLPFALIMQGTARGSLMTIALLTLLDVPEVGSRRAALAGGMFFTTAEIGGVLGPVTMGITGDLTGSFLAAIMLMVGICVVLMGLLWMLHRAIASSGPNAGGDARRNA